MIELKSVSKVFQTKDIETRALDDICLKINSSEFVSIMGPSGCGKSTLLNLLGLLDNPTSGELWFLEEEVSRYTENNRTDLRNGNLGFVFQSFNLFANRTVLENCTLPLITVKRMDRKTAKNIALNNLEKVGMASFQHRGALELSGGQKQRVAIARALCMEPQLMLFDEPTSALDPEMVGEVLEVVKSLAQRGTTMIVVSHEMTFVRTISTRVLFLDKGVIEEDAPPQELFMNPRSERVKEFLSHHML